jgi:hypothetical protein
MTAVGGCLALCAPLLDDQNAVEAAEAAARRAAGGDAGTATGLVAAMRLNERSGAAPEPSEDGGEQQGASCSCLFLVCCTTVCSHCLGLLVIG